MNFPVLVSSAIAACLVPTSHAQLSALHSTPQTKVQAHKVTIAPSLRARHTAFVGGSDSCATPDAISGPGPFSFDNSAATTGAEGQAEAACNFFGTMGITNDVWFTWTAGSSGNAVLALCGGTSMDSKVAIYAGGGCPSGSAISCNDDSCSVQSQVTWAVTNGSQYTIQLGNFPGASRSSGTFTISIAGGTTNDDCSTPTVLTGPGPYPFDNSTATTGSQGQAESICSFSGQVAISSDVWFTWTAPGSGYATVALCGLSSMDSKLAVYAGAGCPASSALACNDDSCGLQSQATFTAIVGNTYTIQLGNYPGASPSSGSFSITIAPPLGACSNHDDGSSDNAIGLTGGGAVCWLQRFGALSQNTTVTQISTAWGSPINPPTGNPPDGTAIDIVIYSDPNNDGDPSDGILIQHISGILAGSGMDTFQTFNLSPPVTINGYLWVGAGLNGARDVFPAPLDQPLNPSATGQAWIVGNSTGVLDFGNLGANDVVPLDIAKIGFPGQWLLRISCSSGPGTSICAPGAGGVIACPCNNPQVPAGSDRGCNNSANTGGAQLTATGVASLASDTLQFTSSGEKPTASSVFLQGTNQTAGVVFGQGVLCMSGTLKRLYVHPAVAGSVSAPIGTDQSVSVRSATLGDVIAPGATRYYGVYYRDPTVLNGCPLTSSFNVSQQLGVLWAP